MNKKGQVVFVGLMLGIVIIVLALALIPSIKESNTQSMADMNCTNSTITKYTEAGCMVTDITPAYFIGGLLLIGGVVITAKIILG